MMKRTMLWAVLSISIVVLSVSSAQAQSAWGGGCNPSSGNRACIGLVWPTLYADFYLDDWTGVDPDGYAVVYICVLGDACYYRYWAYTDHLGHYPVADLDVPVDDGSAYFLVAFYDEVEEHGVISYLESPYQYWSNPSPLVLVTPTPAMPHSPLRLGTHDARETPWPPTRWARFATVRRDTFGS